MPKPTPIETPHLDYLISELSHVGQCEGLSPEAYDLVIEATHTPERFAKYYIGVSTLLNALKEIKIVINN